MEQRSFFIVLEGINGAGKTTQAQLLATELINNGYDVILAYEPGVTNVGENIRTILKSTNANSIDPLAQLLLYNAARIQLVKEIILPALQNNQIVILDRYVYSSIAYQGYGQCIDLNVVETICDLSTATLDPDLVILLDIELPNAINRTTNRNISDPKLNLNIGFHQRVAQGFYDMFDRYKTNGKWHIVDGNQSQDKVFSTIQNIIYEELFNATQ